MILAVFAAVAEALCDGRLGKEAEGPDADPAPPVVCAAGSLVEELWKPED